MPRKLSRCQRLLTTAGVAVAALAAMPGAAMAAECTPASTTQAFAAFGDTNQYFMAPSGAFDSLDGWSRRGTPELVKEFNLLGLDLETRAVDIDSGDGVTSASFCVDATMPHLRFTAKVGRGGGQLDVTVTTTYNGSSNSSGGSISPDAHKSWAPSRNVDLNTKDIPAGESGMATVSFLSQGDWKVDDVYIDPYRR
jgi:hypothetical protein